MIARRLHFGVKMAGIFLVALAVGGLVVMLLWNALAPDLFHGPILSYWQAVGLLILSHVLLRGGPHSRPSWRHEVWRRKMEEHLAGMTPEGREQFRSHWKHDCSTGEEE